MMNGPGNGHYVMDEDRARQARADAWRTFKRRVWELVCFPDECVFYKTGSCDTAESMHDCLILNEIEGELLEREFSAAKRTVHHMRNLGIINKDQESEAIAMIEETKKEW